MLNFKKKYIKKFFGIKFKIIVINYLKPKNKIIFNERIKLITIIKSINTLFNLIKFKYIWTTINYSKQTLIAMVVKLNNIFNT